MTTGERIRIAREAVPMTQKELSKALGVSESYISQYERNIRNPKQETLQKIAAALECDYLWLLTGSGQIDALRKVVEHGLKEQIQASGLTDTVESLQHQLDSIFDPLTKKSPITFKAESSKIAAAIAHTMREEDLMKAYRRLNDAGQQKAVERVEELTEIPKYQREETPPAGAVKPTEDK